MAPVTADLWTQLHEARKRDHHEEKHKTQALRQLRNQEIEAELSHPQCCELAKMHIYPYRDIDVRRDAVLNGGVPQWKNTFPTGWQSGDFHRVFLTMRFCPFCGTKLPGFRKKKNPPKHLIIEDGGHCGRCKERYGMGYCFCSHPESAYEPDV
jgi:hypothetical protein